MANQPDENFMLAELERILEEIDQDQPLMRKRVERKKKTDGWEDDPDFTKWLKNKRKEEAKNKTTSEQN